MRFLGPGAVEFDEFRLGSAVPEPETFVQTRLNLLSMLREVDTIGGDAVIVRVNDTERYSREASEAEEQFGIVARSVPSSTGGKLSVEGPFANLP